MYEYVIDLNSDNICWTCTTIVQRIIQLPVQRTLHLYEYVQITSGAEQGQGISFMHTYSERLVDDFFMDDIIFVSLFYLQQFHFMFPRHIRHKHC